MDWFVQLPEHVGELAKTWMGITILVALGAIGVAKILQFIAEVFSSVYQFFWWWRERVTVDQGGETVTIGTVASFGHQWVFLRHLYGFEGNVKCGFCRNRIDMIRLYVPGDENFLVRPGVKEKPPQSVSDSEDEKAEDEGDDGGD